VSAALIIVDVQNDFTDIPGAALPVSGGAAVAAAITEHVSAAGDSYAAVVATRDWHVDPGLHFSEAPDFVDTWPPHCVAGSPGAEFHPGLDLESVEAIFSKGGYSASYTGFDGSDDEGVPLGEWLATRGVDEVVIVGLATDHCVRATALDAVRAGFTTTVRTELSAGVAEDSTESALEEMRAAGINVV
jgi:nicotinamidase/pyrazinamidase